MWISAFFLWALSFQESPLNLDKKGLALQGYDPVSYFHGEPQEGNEKWAVKQGSSLYYFSSEANKTTFLESPKKYMPQYGGWCAYAMGLSPEKVKINPETFKIVDGKLYLFYDFWGTNTREPWNENEEELMRNADINWEKINER